MYSAARDRLDAPQNIIYHANVTGPFYVTDQCIICALPVETAPKNIQWHFEARSPDCPRSCRVIKQPETDEELRLVIEAMLGSCVEAIRYRGTDPAVLKRLKELGAKHLCDAL
jgi:hypothetical protein